jgi:hypothetical protein
VTAARGQRSARVSVTVHLEREVGIEVKRLARERGISASACTAALVAEALRAPLEHEHASLFEGVLARVVNTHLGHLEELAFRAALRSDEARLLAEHILASQRGNDLAAAVRRDVHSKAWQRLTDHSNHNGAEGG